MQNESDLERRAALLKQRTTKSAQEITFHGLSQWTAKALMIAAFLIWLRAYWVYIAPWSDARGTAMIDLLTYALNGLIDTSLTVLFAAAQAIIPPLTLSAISSNSPANAILMHIKLKISGWWLIFALGIGIALSWQSFWLLDSFWASRPFFADPKTTADPMAWAGISIVLLIGFPSWALNQLLPAQWIDSMLMAREALRIKHIIDLEDATGKALIARVRGLLLIDTMELTIEERAANNAEVAGILAGAARGFKQALIQCGASYKALGGYEMNLRLEQDDAINLRFAQIGKLLSTTTDQFDGIESFARTLADDRPVSPAPARSLPPSSANASDRSITDHSGPVVAANGQWPHYAALEQVYVHFGFEPWRRTHLEELLKIQKTQAAKFITDWKEVNAVSELTEPKFTYVITAASQNGGRA